MGKSATCDATVVNPLNPSLILGASATVGYSAAKKEAVKMTKNGPKCAEFGWECIPLAVETYGGWGDKAQETFNCTSRRLAVGSASSEAMVRQDMYMYGRRIGEGER